MKYIENNNCNYKILKNNIIVFYEFLKSLADDKDLGYLESARYQDILQFFWDRVFNELKTPPKNFKTTFNKINVVLRKIKKNNTVKLSNYSTLIIQSIKERY